MLTGTRKLVAVAVFAVLLIILINLSWWMFYERTETLLDQQLGRRLASIGSATARAIPTETVEYLVLGDFDAYLQATVALEQVRQADSLAEVFIIDQNYVYLATTLLEADSVYFLSEINGKYIDSLFYGEAGIGLVTESYQTGEVYLKSAFAILFDSDNLPAAVIGVEANVDYFDALYQLRQSLYYSTGISVVGGLLFGLLFLLFQRRLNLAEQKIFLSETDAFLGRMVAVVSHEIKNPLMIIRASAERLAGKHDDEEAKFILEETDRLNEITTGYLQMAASDRVGLIGRAQPKEFDLAELVGSLKKHIIQKYPDKQLKWLENSEAEALEITGYRNPLRQVLLNLLINGTEACISANKPIQIGVTLTVIKDKVVILVLDRGPGISKKDTRRVFRPFYTTSATGSGLGLYLSKRLVTEMGGTLELKSTVGKQTEMIITLPKTAE